MKRKAVERVIYDNYNLDEMYDEAKESLIEHMERENPTDSDIWDEIYLLDSFNWDEEKANLETVFDNGKFLAVGTCGLWYGNFAGGFVFDKFNDLMRRFKDCDYIKMWDENGHFYMKGSHHDGTHEVEIKRITDRGLEYFDNWNYSWNDKRTEREVHKRMFTDSHYTKLIHYMHNKYGCKKREFENGKENAE